MTDEEFMRVALTEAARARDLEEVPIGACLVSASGEVLAAASNRTIAESDPTAHAEVLVIRAAARKVGNYRLTGSTVYTTIEPCAMCAGALVNARVSRLVFAAHDERFGAVETKFRLCDSPHLNHKMVIDSGLLADEARALMQDFFRERRASKASMDRSLS